MTTPLLNCPVSPQLAAARQGAGTPPLLGNALLSSTGRTVQGRAGRAGNAAAILTGLVWYLGIVDALL